MIQSNKTAVRIPFLKWKAVLTAVLFLKRMELLLQAVPLPLQQLHEIRYS